MQNQNIASYGQFLLGNIQFVSPTSQIDQSFLGSNQTILLLISNRNIWKES